MINSSQAVKTTSFTYWVLNSLLGKSLFLFFKKIAFEVQRQKGMNIDKFGVSKGIFLGQSISAKVY